MAECPKCDGEGWLWRHELPDPHYEPCEVDSDDTQYTCPYCAGTGDAAAEIDRLRAEVESMREEAMARGAVNRELHAEIEALNERLHKIAASVNSLPTCKVAVDGVLLVPTDRYNALIDVLRDEGED